MKLCRECGDELHPAEDDITGLCDECWEELTEQIEDDSIFDIDTETDPLAHRDDEMGM